MEQVRVSAPKNASALQVFQEMSDSKSTYAIVTRPNGRQILGIVTESDYIKGMARPDGGAWMESATVEQCMPDHDLIYVAPNDDCQTVIQQMQPVDGGSPIRQVVVLDGLVPVGVITQDIIRDWFVHKHIKTPP